MLSLTFVVSFCSGAEKQSKVENIQSEEIVDKGTVKTKEKPTPFEVRKNSIGMAFVWIPPGEFMMGRKLSESELKRKYYNAMLSEKGTFWDKERIKSEIPRHLVKITKGFWVGRHEVTQAQYRAIMGRNPSFYRYKCPNCSEIIDPLYLKEDAFSDSTKDHPVEELTWFQAIEFCKKLGNKEEREYSLPTEAQWEYACRAGTTTCFSFGDDFSEIGKYAWYDGNAENTTHPVGQKIPNAWGLYDMHGNVAEWCLDRYDPNFYTNEIAIDPVCSNAIYLKADIRVVRGGSIILDNALRSASRHWFYNSHLTPGTATGFRVVCSDLLLDGSSGRPLEDRKPPDIDSSFIDKVLKELE